ncbi:dephospho-CoA kinase [Leuconostocaceae bacterium ESL0958]|nr:dephospho-CoA kinase [Leuconostocaceae bacterium ESL0958]
MKVIGITGGIASGKSQVVKQVRAAGYPVLDADEVARIVVEPGTPTLEKIKDSFGQDVMDNGVLNRAYLGKLVFEDPAKLALLNQITQPVIFATLKEQRSFWKMQGASVLFMVIPLLFEQGYDQIGWFDEIILVDTDPAVAKKRLMARNHLDEYEAQRRILTQAPLAEKKTKADRCFDNNGEPAALQQQVSDYLATLTGQ